MKFKITEVTTGTVKVQYEDDSWALVPISKTQTKKDIHQLILSYNNTPTPFANIKDVPVSATSDFIEAEVDEDQAVTYKAARASHYPPVGDQMDALHWAREGDDTNLKAIDTAIKTVKTKIPKGKTYKGSEVAKLLD